MNNYDFICQLYERCVSSVTGNFNFTFTPSERDNKVILNFLSFIDKEYSLHNIGEQFLYEYVLFAFSSRYNQKTRFGKGIVYVNHVFGQKQFKYWIERDEHYKYHIDNFANLFKIYLSKKEKFQFSNLPNEEKIKKQYLNTENGLINCLEFTSLFSFHSINCRICKFRPHCIEILKSNYPIVYNTRFKGKS